ncbi:hypothetical protein ScPMuIL_010821 [Solemya velum]
MSDKDLLKLLADNTALKHIPESGKVKCSLSGHEMPYKLEAVLSYIQGKKYKKLLTENNYDYEKYKVHLVPSTKKGRQHQLFCLLTLRHLNKSAHHIERHIQGRRFQKALAKWQECEKAGTKFQPNHGRKKQPLSEWEDEMDVDDKESVDTDDSMSDLYPASDFPLDQEMDDQDCEMEDVEAQAVLTAAGEGETKGIKRKPPIQNKKTKAKTKPKRKR